MCTWVKSCLAHGGENFSCCICGKRFLHDKTLSSHWRVHTGEKSSTSSVCKAGFSVRHENTLGERAYGRYVVGQNVCEWILRNHLTVHTERKLQNAAFVIKHSLSWAWACRFSSRSLRWSLSQILSAGLKQKLGPTVTDSEVWFKLHIFVFYSMSLFPGNWVFWYFMFVLTYVCIYTLCFKYDTSNSAVVFKWDL